MSRSAEIKRMETVNHFSSIMKIIKGKSAEVMNAEAQRKKIKKEDAE